MPFLQTKLYRTRNKSSAIIFFPESGKKVVFVLSAAEIKNTAYLENLKKTTTALGIDFDKEVILHAVGENEVFNWSGIMTSPDPMTFIFLGKDLSGIEDRKMNTTYPMGNHVIFETYSMHEIVSDNNKKAQFWVSFKSIFGK